MKFEQIHRCLRDMQLASEKANSDMFSLSREGRARGRAGAATRGNALGAHGVPAEK